MASTLSWYSSNETLVSSVEVFFFFFKKKKQPIVQRFLCLLLGYWGYSMSRERGGGVTMGLKI